MDETKRDQLRADAAVASATGAAVQVEPSDLRELLADGDRLAQTRQAAAYAVRLTDLASSAARLSERALAAPEDESARAAALEAIGAWHAAGGK